MADPPADPLANGVEAGVSDLLPALYAITSSNSVR